MGISTFDLSEAFAKEWLTLASAAGCSVDVTDETWLGFESLATIACQTARIQLALGKPGGIRWQGAVLPSGRGQFSRDLAICVVAQIIASGGGPTGGKDIAGSICIWKCEENLFDRPRFYSNGIAMDLKHELLWNSRVLTIDQLPLQKSFSSVKLNFHKASVRLWTGPATQGTFFVAHAPTKGLFHKVARSILTDALIRTLVANKAVRAHPA
jgi:hypothetical protein